MTDNALYQQQQVMEAYGQTTDKQNIDQCYLYSRLIHEEFYELRDELNIEFFSGNTLKELADMIIVCSGLISSIGADPNDVVNVVNDNNRLKASEGTSKNQHGKVMKSKRSILSTAEMMVDLSKLARSTESK